VTLRFDCAEREELEFEEVCGLRAGVGGFGFLVVENFL
jgi:hypothetical protein